MLRLVTGAPRGSFVLLTIVAASDADRLGALPVTLESAVTVAFSATVAHRRLR